MRDGTVKGDIVVHKGEPYVIELAARLSGGFFCTREIPLNTGVDFIGCAIRVALGERIPPRSSNRRGRCRSSSATRFRSPAASSTCAAPRRAKHVPGIADVIVTARPGDIIPPAGDKRPSGAMVLATGRNREEALAAANAGLSAIEIETR